MVCVLFLAGCNNYLDNSTGKGAAAGEFSSIGAESSGVDKEATLQSIDKLAAARTASNAAYKIGPQDLLIINVFSVPSLSREMQVSGSGTINMPLIGEVYAAGKTAQQLERELTARLGSKYLQNPQVSLNIKEYNSQRFTVEGAVKKPGVFPIKQNNTLLQCISAAEGLDKDVASSVVGVFRRENGQRTGAKFDLEAIRSGKSDDPLIKDGDVIVVATSDGKTVFSNFVKLAPLLSIFRPI